jgi:hypothetical protein
VSTCTDFVLVRDPDPKPVNRDVSLKSSLPRKPSIEFVVLPARPPPEVIEISDDEEENETLVSIDEDKPGGDKPTKMAPRRKLVLGGQGVLVLGPKAVNKLIGELRGGFKLTASSPR